ncbi:hypothetical protein BDW71DRAFT_165124 [Aspergillus fruticulosus]
MIIQCKRVTHMPRSVWSDDNHLKPHFKLLSGRRVGDGQFDQCSLANTVLAGTNIHTVLLLRHVVGSSRLQRGPKLPAGVIYPQQSHTKPSPNSCHISLKTTRHHYHRPATTSDHAPLASFLTGAGLIGHVAIATYSLGYKHVSEHLEPRGQLPTKGYLVLLVMEDMTNVLRPSSHYSEGYGWW